MIIVKFIMMNTIIMMMMMCSTMTIKIVMSMMIKGKEIGYWLTVCTIGGGSVGVVGGGRRHHNHH